MNPHALISSNVSRNVVDLLQAAKISTRSNLQDTDHVTWGKNEELELLETDHWYDMTMTPLEPCSYIARERIATCPA